MDDRFYIYGMIMLLALVFIFYLILKKEKTKVVDFYEDEKPNVIIPDIIDQIKPASKFTVSGSQKTF